MAKIKPPPAYPDVLIIGAPEAGGDTIKAVLSQNQKVWFPPLDNILAFHSSFQIERLALAKQFLNGEIPFKLRNLRWLVNFFFQPIPTKSWYSRLFKTKADNLLKIELSDEYLTLPFDEVEQLHQILPKCKIVLMIRNPVDRSYAALRNKFMYNKKTPFNKLTKRQLLTLMNSDWARTHSSYQNALDGWLVFFARANIFIGFYDDMLTNPPGFFSRLQSFIGLEGELPANLQSLIPRPEKMCPESILPHLHGFYRIELEGLAKRLGGYAVDWYRTMPAPVLPVKKSQATPPPEESPVKQPGKSRKLPMTSRHKQAAK